MKEYKILAWIGFISLIIFTCYGVYNLIIYTTPKPEEEIEELYMTEVTNETQEEYVPKQSITYTSPVSVPAFVAPEVVEEPIQASSTVNTAVDTAVETAVETGVETGVETAVVSTIVIDTDIEWKPLCLALVELVGTPREEYGKQAMSSYRSCAGTFLTIAQRMANSGLMGIVFADTFVQLSTEYQLLSV